MNLLRVRPFVCVVISQLAMLRRPRLLRVVLLFRGVLIRGREEDGGGEVTFCDGDDIVNVRSCSRANSMIKQGQAVVVTPPVFFCFV